MYNWRQVTLSGAKSSVVCGGDTAWTTAPRSDDGSPLGRPTQRENPAPLDAGRGSSSLPVGFTGRADAYASAGLVLVGSTATPGVIVPAKVIFFR